MVLAPGNRCMGQYLDAMRVADDLVSAFVKGKDGVKVQGKIWKALGEKLEEIQHEHNGDALISVQSHFPESLNM